MGHNYLADSCEKRNERFFTSADGLAAFALELEGGEPDKTCTMTMQNVRNEKKPGQERAVSSSSNATEGRVNEINVQLVN